MIYKVGDKVRVKSLEWYNSYKSKEGNINCSDRVFFAADMSEFCGSIVTIKDIDIDLGAYNVEENSYYWIDDMIVGLAESNELNKVQDNEQTFKEVDDVDYVKPVVFENIVFPNENYADKVELCLSDDYEIVVEDGRTFVQRKKPKYPTTYEECCEVLGIDVSRTIGHSEDYPFYRDVTCYENNLLSSLAGLRKLLICRDAYWKIAGEQMGLSKSWEPDWNESKPKYTIVVIENKLVKHYALTQNYILAFPTEEMRDAFYDNFKNLIENCKELL